MKTGKIVLIALLGLAGSAFSRVGAVIPPKYTGEICRIKENTYPTRMILKYFKPIDKGFSVEIGEPTSTVLVVDYDTDHRPVAYSEYSLAGDLMEKYEMTYNPYGHISVVQKSDMAHVQLRTEYGYANPKEEKSLKEKKFYSADQRLLYTDSYLRDKAGNVSSMKRADADGNIQYSYIYFYDESGFPEREIRLDVSGQKQAEKECTYTEWGARLTESSFDASGKLAVHLQFGYDSDKVMNSVSMSIPGGAKENYRMDYEYDEYGNWIRQTVYKGSGQVPTSVLVRIFEY